MGQGKGMGRVSATDVFIYKPGELHYLTFI